MSLMSVTAELEMVDRYVDYCIEYQYKLINEDMTTMNRKIVCWGLYQYTHELLLLAKYEDYINFRFSLARDNGAVDVLKTINEYKLRTFFKNEAKDG